MTYFLREVYTHDRATRGCRDQPVALPCLQGNRTLHHVRYELFYQYIQEKRRTIKSIVERYIDDRGIQSHRAAYDVSPIVGRCIPFGKATLTQHQRQKISHLSPQHTTINILRILVNIMLDFQLESQTYHSDRKISS